MKYVRPGKKDGCYLESVYPGKPAIWNWGASAHCRCERPYAPELRPAPVCRVLPALHERAVLATRPTEAARAGAVRVWQALASASSGRLAGAGASLNNRYLVRSCACHLRNARGYAGVEGAMGGRKSKTACAL